ncbi:TetR/AcrR family transcriptional regulator [Penaeicola halotolerans]|uniref:TetR/AcrR family transcriptional regulator n=1 Tax=Penaeicola halotolerans TaxID=2793196 RepID=UPI001CF87725|nr:TetR/AcrR family transcriptional regulator [Penaeicola halotolerans]
MEEQENNLMRSKILEAALGLFVVNGYKETTMDDIAKHLKISKKTLYKYYQGKYELLSLGVAQIKSNLTKSVEQILSAEDEFPIKLRNMLSVVGFGLANIKQRVIQDLKELAPNLWEDLNAYKREAAFVRFQRLIDEGVRSGYISPKVNKEMAVLLYASIIQNLLDPDFLDQFPSDFKDKIPDSQAGIFEQSVMVLLEGILTPEARKVFESEG